MRSILSAALRFQESEEATGFSAANPALVRLTSDVDFWKLLRHTRHFRTGDVAQRQLHARILASAAMPAGRRVSEVLETLVEESEPRVIRWLVFALRNAASRPALPGLLDLARHPSPDVRFPVPDTLSACAERLGDIDDALLRLSHDVDADVRWSTVFELGAWWSEVRDPRLEARLQEVRDDDPSDVVRHVAEEALRKR